MKSKKIIFVSLILISLTALLFTGCTPAAEKKDDSKTEIPNPMVEQASLEAIKEAIGFSFESLPTGITDVKYFTIADNLAQADFTEMTLPELYLRYCIQIENIRKYNG